MAEEQNDKIFEGDGTIEKKEEATTKDNAAYWKFVIDGKTYSLFEHESGLGVKVGEKVGMFWKEKKGTYKGKPVTYRNLTSIFEKGATEEAVYDTADGQPPTSVAQPTPQPEPSEPTPVKPSEPPKNMQAVTDYKANDANRFELGMAKNNAAILIGKMLEQCESIDQQKDFLRDNGDYMDKLTTALYNRYKKLREQLLGY